MAGGVREDLLPHGEALRSAVRWIGSQRLENEKRPLHELLDEAALRFDLSPVEAEFLRANWLLLREEPTDTAQHLGANPSKEGKR